MRTLAILLLTTIPALAGAQAFAADVAPPTPDRGQDARPYTPGRAGNGCDPGYEPHVAWRRIGCFPIRRNGG